jgi:predicted MFS family arabinose efflux permease
MAKLSSLFRDGLPQRWLMLMVLFLIRLAMGYQFQSVASVSSHLVNQLGFSYVEIGTLIGLFLLPGIFIAIPSGLLTRAVTNKNLLMIGAATMIVGALVMGTAETPRALFAGRLITGIGGTIFNVILTKMVTEWFFGKEIVTALAIMLTAWPIGISLGLLTQGFIADTHGWAWAFHATGALALVSLILTATLYRDPVVEPNAAAQPLRFGVPRRQFVHVSVVSCVWALYNAALVILVSFAPDVLVNRGFSPEHARSTVSLAMWATLISIPLGGRVLEVLGWVTFSIVMTLAAAAAIMVAIAYGIAPEILCFAFGLIAGIPAGALVALSSESLTPENRGPGLGIFYTGYYIGMAAGPALAGWSRDVSGSAAAPVLIGAAMLLGVILSVGVLRVLQRMWPIVVTQPAAAS